MRGFRLVLLFVAVCGLWTLVSSPGPGRSAAIVLEEAEVRALCAASGYPPADFYERARAAGVWGIAFEPRTLEESSRAGGLLHFSRADVEKMRRLGLLGPRSPLQGGSVWSKDERELALVDRVLERRGFSSRKAVMGGLRGLLFPEEAPGSLRAGFDRAAVDGVRAKELVPVLHVADDADAEAAAALASPTALLVAPDYRGPVPARVEAAWLVLPERARPSPRSERAAWARAATASSARALEAARIEASGGIAPMERALARGAEMLLVRLPPELGLERAFAELRVLSAQARRRGLAGPEPLARAERTASSAERLLLWGLLFVLATLGPMAALRRGLDCARALSRIVPPLASPLLESAAALIVCALWLLPFGAGVHALSSARSWRLGLCPPGLEAAVFLCALLIGGAALYPADPRVWRRDGGGLLRAAAGLCAAFLLLRRILAPEPFFAGMGLLFPEWDAFILRWPEILLGQGALFAGCWAFVSRPRDDQWASSRGALLLGLLGLCGAVLSFTSREPFLTLAARACASAALGVPAGLLLVAIFGRKEP